MTKLSNEALVEKAVIVADNLATGGKLNNEQSNQFIDYVMDQSKLKNNARILRFRAENLDIDKLGIGRRAAVPKAEAVDPGVRRGVTPSKVTLTPKEIMVPFEIGDNFRELNIEGDAVEDRVIQMFAKQTGNDTEELCLLGNTLGPAVTQDVTDDGGVTDKYVKDTFLALTDGWQKLTDSAHIVNAGGANIGSSIFGQAIRAMPTKFRRDKSQLRFFMSSDLAQIYYEKLSTRATNLGDAAAAGSTISPFGVPIVEVPLWDFNPIHVEHVVLNGTTAVSLAYTGVTDVVVTPSTLYKTPTTPYVSGTDYTLDAAAGTIARDGGGSIGDGDTVKVTYGTSPQLLLTHMSNFIVGYGRDITIEKAREIFKGVNQYAITLKVAGQIEELDACVKVKNIGTGV